MAHVITSARAVSETRDVALMAWAHRNLACELERRGDARRFFRRRARTSRFPAAARHEALAWEAKQRHHCLAAVADMAALLDEIDGLTL
ncbi:hypothetical protein EOM89_14300 [Candidatus Falkowbacteria bacterium]|nr:hypothetical protein [Candidatus Falkowbacteria bacterium]